MFFLGNLIIWKFCWLEDDDDHDDGEKKKIFLKIVLRKSLKENSKRQHKIWKLHKVVGIKKF